MSDQDNKKMKLSLDDLQVQSFVTALDNQGALGFQGGANSLNPEETDNTDCCRDLTLPRSSCQLCGGGTWPDSRGGCVTWDNDCSFTGCPATDDCV